MKVGIYGAGSIGCYVGGRLAAGGDGVAFLGRPSMATRLADALILTSFDGRTATVPLPHMSQDIKSLTGCDVVLVCVKSMDTAAVARTLADVIAPDTLIVSLQNGVSNTAILREALPGNHVLAGIVTFNVVQIGGNRFHQGTEGEIILEDAKGALQLATTLVSAGVAASVDKNIKAVLWGKLLMNLNNAVNAISGLPLKQQLSIRKHRLVLADCIEEGLRVLRKAGIKPAKIGKVSPGLAPTLLRLPDPVFRIVASGMLQMDDDARSSMAEDLERGREPEIEHLQGEIVRLGRQINVPTPVNVAVMAKVQEIFNSAHPANRAAR
ncbi:MAG: 2-dehydropantoate 2-reductase [Rhizobiaceae bacterium]